MSTHTHHHRVDVETKSYIGEENLTRREEGIFQKYSWALNNI